MAAITDPSAVAFSNKKIRVMADMLYASYQTAKSLLAEWNATGMSSLITNTADLIIDGSPADGRTQITGAQATNLVTPAQEIIADYEASANAKLNTVSLVQVNGGARF